MIERQPQLPTTLFTVCAEYSGLLDALDDDKRAGILGQISAFALQGSAKDAKEQGYDALKATPIVVIEPETAVGGIKRMLPGRSSIQDVVPSLKGYRVSFGSVAGVEERTMQTIGGRAGIRAQAMYKRWGGGMEKPGRQYVYPPRKNAFQARGASRTAA
jgi:hypothetical protein